MTSHEPMEPEGDARISVVVCQGPCCRQWGSREVVQALRQLPGRLRERIVIERSLCFARCQEDDPDLLPSVCVDGEWQTRANGERVKCEVRRLVGG